MHKWNACYTDTISILHVKKNMETRPRILKALFMIL